MAHIVAYAGHFNFTMQLRGVNVQKNCEQFSNQLWAFWSSVVPPGGLDFEIKNNNEDKEAEVVF